MVQTFNSEHQLLLPPANWCPIFAPRATQVSQRCHTLQPTWELNQEHEPLAAVLPYPYPPGTSSFVFSPVVVSLLPGGQSAATSHLSVLVLVLAL